MAKGKRSSKEPAVEPKKGHGLWAVLFSVFLIFHVFVIVLMPNGMSYPGRALGPLVQPYAAILGLKTSWNFFSPDPAHTMYLKMTLFWQDEDGGFSREAEELYFPEARNGRVMDVSKRRELYAMRYLMLDSKRVEALLGPWVCKRYPGLTALEIQQVVEPIPDLDRAVLFSKESLRDLSEVRPMGRVEYRCSQVGDEVVL